MQRRAGWLLICGFAIAWAVWTAERPVVAEPPATGAASGGSLTPVRQPLPNATLLDDTRPDFWLGDGRFPGAQEATLEQLRRLLPPEARLKAIRRELGTIRAELESLIKDHPDSPEAREARRLLDSMPALENE